MDRPEELEFAWLMVIGISLTFILSLSIIVFFVIYQRKLHAQNLRVNNVKQEERQKRLKAVIEMQEHERDRIGKDLHDELGVLLSTTKLYLTYDEPPGENAELLGKAAHLLDEAVVKLRSISRNLSSEHLEKFGLERSIVDMLRQLEEVAELEVHFDCQINERLPFFVELQLFRIIAELLNNTLKHAGATNLRINLKVKGETLHLIFQDNGCGFDLGQEPQSKGLGLATLSGRVQLLDGEMSLQSDVGEGTLVTITIPNLAIPTNHEREYHQSSHRG